MAEKLPGSNFAEKEKLYRSKFITVDDALGMLKSGDTIAVGAYGNEPRSLLRKLHTVGDRVEDVMVWIANCAEVYPFFTMDELKGKIDILTFFYGNAQRLAHPSGRVSLSPNNLHWVSQCFMETRRPNVFWATVTPMDKYGYVCMSMSQVIEQEMLDNADLIVFEVNPNLPRTLGTVRVPVEHVDYFIESNEEVFSTPSYPASPEQQKIAENVASLIRDGDTIQFGIGGLPNALGDALLDKKDLGIHTEMLGSSMGRLMEAGVVNNTRKNLFRGRSVAAFTWGDKGLYQYLDRNPMVEIMPVRYVNDPFVIAQNDNMVSVNSALQIDLTGQVCSESIGSRQYSATGGATDFAYGAFHSKGGRGIIALNSLARNGKVSRIVPMLDQGAVVSISRNIVDYVVTEYGIAKLRGRTIRQRVENLIAVAHPDFREDMRKKADELMLW